MKLVILLTMLLGGYGLVIAEEVPNERLVEPLHRAVIAEEEVDPNSLHYALSADQRGVDLPTSELKMMLRPLTKEELELELQEWMNLLKQLIANSSGVNLEVARLKEEDLESEHAVALREKQLENRRHELILVKHINTVLSALEQKGGEVETERLYVNAVVETKDATTKSATDQVTALAADFGVWFASHEGGEKFMQNALRFIVILIVFAVLGRLIAGITRRVMRRQHRGSVMLRQFIQKSIGLVIFFIGFLVALAAVGVHVASMLTAVGAGGVIIGFALQDSIANFWSGIMIMVYKPFDADDFISIDGVKGKVERMSFLNTTLVTIDNKELVIPNRNAWGNTITNYTARAVRRVDLVFRISYGDDIQRALNLLKEVAESHKLVLAKPEVTTGVQSLSESAVEIFVRPWTKTEDYWPVHWDLTKEVKERFAREGISIPKPQQEIVMHQAENLPG
ncbi:mechanosensitive ion channel family protein [Rubritalea spongiae]|uniref:Mechanosensitive ion channel family protein n=1 Tax=Rubritalea spongiae TaxID=430797 RepID=A0ABW5E1C0_9BACT